MQNFEQVYATRGLGNSAREHAMPSLHDPEDEKQAGLILDAVEARVAAALVRAPREEEQQPRARAAKDHRGRHLG